MALQTGISSVASLLQSAALFAVWDYLARFGRYRLAPGSSRTSSADASMALSENTNSQGRWEIADSWLSQCIDEHEACNRGPSKPCKPIRLLELRPSKPGTTLRLCLGAECSEEPYVTLSQCWGKEKITKVPGENLDSMMAFIALDPLPKTFKDAITISEKLGILCIWMDRQFLNFSIWSRAKSSRLVPLSHFRGVCPSSPTTQPYTQLSVNNLCVIQD